MGPETGIRPDGRDLGGESFFELLPVEYVFSEKRLDGESEEERDFPTFLRDMLETETDTSCYLIEIHVPFRP